MVLTQEFQSRGDARLALLAQGGVDTHTGDGHSGLAQAKQKPDPFHIGPLVAALVSRVAGDARDQPDSLVVAKRVGRHPRKRRHLRN